VLFVGGRLGRTVAVAAVKLPKLIGDNMVLQRGPAVPIWGRADKGEEVTVTLAGQTLTTKGRREERTMGKVVLAKLDVGEPLEMIVKARPATRSRWKSPRRRRVGMFRAIENMHGRSIRIMVGG